MPLARDVVLKCIRGLPTPFFRASCSTRPSFSSSLRCLYTAIWETASCLLRLSRSVPPSFFSSCMILYLVAEKICTCGSTATAG